MRNAVRHMGAEHAAAWPACWINFEQGLGDTSTGPAPIAISTNTCAASASSHGCCGEFPGHSVVKPYMRCGRPQPGRVLRVRSAPGTRSTLLTGDPDRAETAMRQHVLNAVPALQAFLEQAR